MVIKNTHIMHHSLYMDKHHLIDKAAERGVPSLVWRSGQTRRLKMIIEAAEGREKRNILIDGSGVGAYLSRMEEFANQAVGLEIEHERCITALQHAEQVVQGAGEHLPFPKGTFDLIISNEVIEHVQDDALTIQQAVRTLHAGGRLILFCPNRGYPVETHGIYWQGKYRFGNIPLINYLPRRWRDHLAPHVRVYTRRDLHKLFHGLPVKIIQKSTIFGGYDNIIHRFPKLGGAIRDILYFIERTPLQVFGLSHFWVVEKL